MRVDIHYNRNSSGPIEAIFRSRGELRRLGIQVEFCRENPVQFEKGKVIAIQQTMMTEEILEGPGPLVLLERADAAISWARRYTQHPNVKKVIKGAVLKNLKMHNACRGRYHSYLLNPRKALKASVILKEEDFRKLVPGASYGAYDMMKRWISDRPLLGDRKYDIHFAGTVTYGGMEGETITRHRTSAVKAIKRIAGNHFIIEGRHAPRDEYDAAMQQSKIVVSPWGFGELAYRDYEALYAGAVLIKPDSAFVKTWPSILENEATYIPCRHDWKDLPEKVQYVKDSWKTLEEMRVRNREILLEHWQEKKIAEHYASIFESALKT